MFLATLSAQLLGPGAKLWFCHSQVVVDFICDPSSEECCDLVQWARGDTTCLYAPLEDACGLWLCGLESSGKEVYQGMRIHGDWERICSQLLWFMV